MTESAEHDRIVAEFTRDEAAHDPFAAAVRATRMPMLITDPTQPDNPIVFANAAFSRLTGYAHEDVIGRNCRFLQGGQTDRDTVRKIRDAIHRRVTIETEILNYRKDGTQFWNRLLISPVFDEDGVLSFYFASQFDVTLERERLVLLESDRSALEQEVERRTIELQQSERRMRFVLQAGRFGSWTLDLSSMRLVASDICKENFGRAARDPFTYQDLVDSIDPQDRERMRKAVLASIEDKSEYDIEYKIITPSGARRWIQVRGQVFYASDGTPLSMAGVSLDITERKRAEEHRNLLADELNHRVKNSMATIQSIAHQTLRNASSIEEARDTLEHRLQSLAAAHDVLTEENWEGTTITHAVEGALAPFRASSRISFGGPDVVMPPRIALAFMLALHEMATNAVKYGALSNDTGRIIINWEVLDALQDRRLWLRWEELGGPPVDPPRRTGFGTRMIERALSAEFGGTVQIDYRPRGVTVLLEAPLPS